MIDDVHFFSSPPSPDLRPFVDVIWGVRGGGAHSTEAVLPNGAVELMIGFGPDQEVIGHGDRRLRATYRRAWLAGMQDRRLVHRSTHGADHVAVRFRPGGAHAFFDLPMHETANRVIDLDLVVGKAARSLRDRLGETTDDRMRVAILEKWLRRRQRVSSFFPTAGRALEMLRDGGSFRAPVGSVCEQLGLSNKHLVAQFRRTVGLPPKIVGRIQRFQAVIRACRGRRSVDWLDVAHAHGYADQPHLIREFRRLGSVTPVEFLERRTPDESHVVID